MTTSIGVVGNRAPDHNAGMVAARGVTRAADATPGSAGQGAVTSWHVHWFRWAGYEPFGNGSRYACRCGAARAGI